MADCPQANTTDIRTGQKNAGKFGKSRKVLKSPGRSGEVRERQKAMACGKSKGKNGRRKICLFRFHGKRTKKAHCRFHLYGKTSSSLLIFDF
jgi:hypothetical protein